MIDLNKIFEKEFEKIKILDGTKEEFINKYVNELKKIFAYIFSINYYKNKAETRRFFGQEFNMTFSLLLESVYAIFTGQCRSALLLLRSAQETNYRFVLERERESMLIENPDLSFESLDYRFIETKRKFINDINKCLDRSKFNEYFLSVERNLTYYKKLSSVVHSNASRNPVMNIDYFSKIHEELIVDDKKYFELFHSVLNEIYLLNFFLLRKSLYKWDYYALENLLRLLYGKKRTKTLIELVK